MEEARLGCGGSSRTRLSIGDDGGGDATLTRAGYEKLIEEALLLGLFSSRSSFEGLAIAASDVLMLFISPTSAPPNQDGEPSLPSFWDARRTGVLASPRLFALRCCCRAGPPVPLLRVSKFSGSAGTGGASCPAGEVVLAAGLCGLGVLKVFSDREALLPLLCNDGFRRASGAVPEEDMDALRRMVRLVWTSETLVGVVGRARRAAAAAADDKDCCDP